jgi:broad specificity phosphatase PhoE
LTRAPDPRLQFPLPLHGGELILVRHGESTANVSGIGQGRADYPLSERGRRQATLTGQYLATLGEVAALYASPLARAWETATLIGAALGLPPHPVPDLVEIDIGALSGRTMAELKALYPAQVAAYEAASAASPHPTNRELLPGWEPIDAIVARVWPAVVGAAAAHAGGRVVVVTHGGVINAFLTHRLDGDAREVPWRHLHTNCAISRLALAATGPHLLCHANDAHLGDYATG